MKKRLWFTLAFIVSLVLEVSAIFFGIYCTSTWLGTAQNCSYIILSLIAVCNVVWFVYSLVQKRKSRRINLASIDREVMEAHAQLEHDPERERTALRCMEWLIWGYWALLMLALWIACTDTREIGWMEILAIFIYPALIGFPFHRKNLVQFQTECELDEKCFPLIFETIRKAARVCGSKRPVRVFWGGSITLGAFSERRYDGILLGDAAISLLTKEELYQGLLHEFVHLTAPESRENARWNQLAARMDHNIDFVEGYMVFQLGTWAMLPLMTAFNHRLSRYFSLTNRRIERETDLRAAELGDAQIAVNALAKISLYGKYKDEEQSVSFEVFAEEQPHLHVSDVEHRHYQKLLNERRVYWLEELELEIPARIDSHPTFRQRREALNVQNYDVTAVETDKDYCRELQELAHYSDQIFRDTMVQDTKYASLRENHYTSRKAAMEVFENTENPFETLDSQKLLEIASAYLGLNTPLSEEIVRSILENEPENYLAALQMGEILLGRRDDAGIEWMYHAAKNPNIAFNALNALGDYLLKRGKAAEMEEFRRRSLELQQEAVNFHHDLREVKAEKLTKHTISDALLQELLDSMLRYGGDALEAIYCACQSMSDGSEAHLFVLQFAKDTDEGLEEEIYQSIFYDLDMRSEQYSLRTIDSVELDEIVNRLPECRVYKK